MGFILLNRFWKKKLFQKNLSHTSRHCMLQLSELFLFSTNSYRFVQPLPIMRFQPQMEFMCQTVRTESHLWIIIELSSNTFRKGSKKLFFSLYGILIFYSMRLSMSRQRFVFLHQYDKSVKEKIGFYLLCGFIFINFKLQIKRGKRGMNGLSQHCSQTFMEANKNNN